MRFYVYDGARVSGPAPVEECMRLAGFNARTLVCPEGATQTSDWKPAQAYAPFQAVLAPPPPPAAPALPAAPLPAAAAQDDAPPRAAQAAKKALICDDDDTIPLLIKDVLAGQGIAVVTAADGNEGLAALRDEKPDCLVLDLNMPGKDGLEVLEELRRSGAALPYVIVLSAQEASVTHGRATALGAREVIVKPFSMLALVAAIKRAVGREDA